MHKFLFIRNYLKAIFLELLKKYKEWTVTMEEQNNNQPESFKFWISIFRHLQRIFPYSEKPTIRGHTSSGFKSISFEPITF